MKKVSDFFGKIKKWLENHKTIVAIFITAAFVLVHIPLINAHEFTADEGTVWGLSKEINLSNIYEVNSVEPHPLLWEVMLAPFSQSGFPIITMNFIALFLVALAVFLFVRFAPIGIFPKLIFILSSAFFFFNPVIARDYSLIPLAICLVCLAYKNRHGKPFLYGLSLAFLAQTHFLMYGLLAVLVIGFILEGTFKKKNVKKILLSILLVILPVGLSVLSTVPEVIGSLNNHAIITGTPSDTSSGSEKFTSDFYMNALGNYFGMFVEAMRWIVAVYAIILLISIFSENIKIGAYLVGSIGFWYYVMANIYKNYFILNHKVAIVSLILLAIVWMLYLEKESEKEKENIFLKLICHIEIVKYLRLKVKVSAIVLVCLLVALTIPRAIVCAKDDLEHKYSNSNEVAAFVNDNIEEDALIIEGDVSTSYSFNVAARVQITKDLDFYNIPLRTFDDYEAKLKYSNELIETYAKAGNVSDEDLKAVFDSASEKYEHVYYVGVVGKNCKGEDRLYNQTLLDEYDEAGTLNNDSYYIEQSKPLLKVFKIK